MKVIASLIILSVSLSAQAKTTCRNILGDLHCDDGTMIREDYFGDIHIQDSHIYRRKTLPDSSPHQPRDYYIPSYRGGSSGEPFLSKAETTAFGTIFTIAGALILLTTNGTEMKVLGGATMLYGVFFWNMDTTD